jgi:hypothetical protein
VVSVPARRLTRTEYENAIADLLGIDVTAEWPQDTVALGFDNQVEAQPFTYGHAQGIGATAEAVALAAIEDLDALLPCDPSDDELACAELFIETFGRRAYRRALSEDEVARLTEVFEATLAADDLSTAIRLVLETILQSTHFHHRFELGQGEPDADGTIALSGVEIASRLSFFFWASGPDEALLDAAEAGELDTPEGVRAEAERMLDDPRARRGLENFYRQWLRLDKLAAAQKDPTLFPDFDDAFAHDLSRGTLEFTSYVTLDAGGDLRDLLTSNIAVVTSRTAFLYGTDAPNGGLPALVVTNEDERAGIITDPAILAAHAKPDQTSPIARGLFVREALLCQTLPSPPDDVQIEVPPLDPTLTTRERYAEHSANPACAGCHSQIDGPGFAFENYDAIGRYRSSENDKPIDASAKIINAEDAEGDVDGALELAEVLADSEIMKRCFTTQVTRYAMGRGETPEDACAIEATSATSSGEAPTIRDILLAVTQRPTFLRRKVAVPESCQ